MLMGLMGLENTFNYAEGKRETGWSNALDLVMGHWSHVERLAMDDICGNTQEVRMHECGDCQLHGRGDHWLIFFIMFSSVQFSSFPLLAPVWLFAIPWIAALQASLSITNSRSSLKRMSIESVMPSSHLIHCHPLLLLPSIPPSIRVFSSESTLHMRWLKYWSFSFSISPSNEQSFQDWSPLGWTSWISLQSKGLSRVSPTPQFKSINSSVLSFLYSPILTFIHDHWKNHSLD